MSWTLTYNATTQTLADWGLSNLHLARHNQSSDICSVMADQDFDAAPLFPYDSDVTIKNGTEQWFVGQVIQIPRSGGPSHESMQYKYG